MLSTNQQHLQVCELLAAIQTCVDRRGRIIPCREVDLAAHVATARLVMGVTSCASIETATRDFYKSGRP